MEDDNIASMILGNEYLNDDVDFSQAEKDKNKIRIILDGKTYKTPVDDDDLEDGEIREFDWFKPTPPEVPRPPTLRRHRKRRKPSHRETFWPPTHHFKMINALLDDYHENDRINFERLVRNFDEYNARPGAFTSLANFTDFYGIDFARDLIVHSISTNGTLRAKFNKLRRRDYPLSTFVPPPTQLFY